MRPRCPRLKPGSQNISRKEFPSATKDHPSRVRVRRPLQRMMPNDYERRLDHAPAREFTICRRLARMSRRWSAYLLLFALGASVAVLRAETINVTLNWEASPSGSVNGYRVYFGAESGIYTNTTDVGNVTVLTIPGLEGGVTYYFVVSAYDATGLESDFSNEVAYTPAVNSAPQASSLQLRVTSAGQMILTLAGLSGRTYDLLASPDLKDWTAIARVTVGTGGALDFTDPEAAKYPARFYRARETRPEVQLRISSAGPPVLAVIGQNNRTYQIQASSNLANWSVIGSVTLGAGGAVEFTDTDAANYPARFYRTQEMQP